MIETAEGREKAEEIITTPGLDGVYIGPADLALSMGLPGRLPQPEHLQEVQRLLALCKKHGVLLVFIPAVLAHKNLELGFNFVTLGSDSGHMTKNAAKELAAPVAKSSNAKAGY